jgi:uncharacterized protein (TIGR01244 family)
MWLTSVQSGIQVKFTSLNRQTKSMSSFREDSGQLSAQAVSEACTANGLAFTHIPVVGQMSQAQVEAMATALENADGPVLAYCRSGTRSTNLWALAQASNGEGAEGLVETAANGGYDLSGLLPTLRALNAR